MSALVSYIIPAYNAEKYLEKCLDMLRKLNGKHNIEIIVVNDGSTDRTSEICRKIGGTDSGIRCYEKENGGVSDARNLGISVADGKYLAFIDVDDEIDVNEYNAVLEMLENDDDPKDIYMFGYCMVDKDTGCKTVMSPNIPAGVYGKETLDELRYDLLDVKFARQYSSQYIGGKVYQYLIKKELFSTRGLKFPVGIHYAEDLCFCLQLMSVGSEIEIFENTPYIYYVNSGSASHKLRPQMWEESDQVYRFSQAYAVDKIQLSRLKYWSAKNTIRHYIEYGMDKGELSKKAKHILCASELRTAFNDLEFSQWTINERTENFLMRNRFAKLLIVFEKILLACKNSSLLKKRK